MGKVKDFRLFIAEHFVEESDGLLELNDAFDLADELWNEACHQNKKAIYQLGKMVRMYRGIEPV